MAERSPLVVVQGSGAIVQGIAATDALRVNNMTITPEGGLAIWLRNGSGEQITRGSVVRPVRSGTDSVILTSPNSLDPIGIAYADMEPAVYGWIVIAGIADVYVDNPDKVLSGYWLGVSTTMVGQCTARLEPPIIPEEHFREVGHTIQERTGPGLVRSVLHFN